MTDQDHKDLKNELKKLKTQEELDRRFEVEGGRSNMDEVTFEIFVLAYDDHGWLIPRSK